MKIDRRRRNTYAALIVVALLAQGAASCASHNAPNGPTSPEGKAAVEGDALVKAADAAVTKADQGMTDGSLPTKIGIPIVKTAREVGVQGKRLATVLAALDAAKSAAEQQASTSQAREILATIQGLIDQNLALFVHDPATQGQVRTLLAGVQDGVGKVRAIIDLLK